MSGDRHQHRIGGALVALQFELIVLLAGLGLPKFLSGQAPTGPWALSALGVLVGV